MKFHTKMTVLVENMEKLDKKSLRQKDLNKNIKDMFLFFVFFCGI